MDSSFAETQDTWSDSEMMALSPLPAVMDAEEEEEVMSALENPKNFEDPKMKGSEPLRVVPLRVVPYGRKKPIPFEEYQINLLRDPSVLVNEQSVREGKQEVGIPLWLESLGKEGDWKAFIKTRSDSHKDWSYEHRLYRRDFRSTLEVKDFLNSDGPTTGMFRGRKLRKKKTPGWDSHGSTGTNKCTRGRKAANSATENVYVDPNHPIKPDMPPGFV